MFFWIAFCVFPFLRRIECHHLQILKIYRCPSCMCSSSSGEQHTCVPNNRYIYNGKNIKELTVFFKMASSLSRLLVLPNLTNYLPTECLLSLDRGAVAVGRWADILALKHISRILGHCSNPALLVSHFQDSIWALNRRRCHTHKLDKKAVLVCCDVWESYWLDYSEDICRWGDRKKR